MTVGIAIVIAMALYLIDKNKVWRQAAKVIAALALLVAVGVGGLVVLERFDNRRTARTEAAQQREVTAWNDWMGHLPTCKVVFIARSDSQIGRTYIVGENRPHTINNIDLSAGLVDFVAPDFYDKLAAGAAHDTLPCKAEWIDPQWKVVDETPIMKIRKKTLAKTCKEWEQKHPFGSPIDRLYGKWDDGTEMPSEGIILGSPEGCRGPLETDYNRRLGQTEKSK